MEKLKELAEVFIWFIRAGVVVRVSYSFLKMIGNDEEINVYKRKIKNAINFYILAESVWVLKDIVTYYFT